MPGDGQPGAQAVALVPCLADGDPFLRDGIAFAGLSAWMRGGKLDPASLRALEQALLAGLDGEDSDGFRRPFIALALSEVARTDRASQWMAPGERARMVAAAAAYLRSVRDHRGYVDGEGWRHGVAHGADWAMQLVLNKALTPVQAVSLLSALATQVIPEDGHTYAFGEPGRLARPVAYAAARGDIDQATLDAWLDSLVASLGPAPEDNIQARWWKRRANLENFLHALGHMVAGEQAPSLMALAASVDTTLAKIP